MFGIETKSEVSPKRVKDATDKAVFRNFGHAAASIRKSESESIVKSKEPSPEGQPPHTRGRGRKSLKRAFRYAVESNEAFIGPVASAVGEVGKAHEFGGQYKDEVFEPRPFGMRALKKALPRLASSFAGSIRAA